MAVYNLLNNSLQELICSSCEEKPSSYIDDNYDTCICESCIQSKIEDQELRVCHVCKLIQDWDEVHSSDNFVAVCETCIEKQQLQMCICCEYYERRHRLNITVSDELICDDCAENNDYICCDHCDYYTDKYITVEDNDYCSHCIEKLFSYCNSCEVYFNPESETYITSLNEYCCPNCVTRLRTDIILNLTGWNI